MEKHAFLGLLTNIKHISVLISFMILFEPNDIDLIFLGCGLYQ